MSWRKEGRKDPANEVKERSREWYLKNQRFQRKWRPCRRSQFLAKACLLFTSPRSENSADLEKQNSETLQRGAATNASGLRSSELQASWDSEDNRVNTTVTGSELWALITVCLL